MAIKTKNSRDTYRSNVKIRPLRQNGLEAQYQGLDISEVNIDHAGLAIIGRGGHQTRRNIRKVRKQYIVDVPQEEHSPTAELIFNLDVTGHEIDRSQWGAGGSNKSLQNLAGQTFALTGSAGNIVQFEFSTDATVANGEALSNSNAAITLVGNEYSFQNLLFAVTGSIEANFEKDTFRFQLFPSGSTEIVIGQENPVGVAEDKIKLFLSSSVVGSAGLSTPLSQNPNYLDVTTNQFDDQRESHEWRLNGFLKDESDDRIFYEDLRTDTIQSTNPHSLKNSEFLFRSEQFPGGYSANPSHDDRSNYDLNINSIAGDPTHVSKNRFDTHDSTEVVIRQYPRREEIFDTYRSNHQWREDIHYLAPDQQLWSRMESLALNYHSSLEDHIAAMMNSNFADEQYIDPNPLSGRVDILKRLSRIFDTHTNLIFERHQYSVFDQYLDPIDDFINLQENRYPKEDNANNDVAFEDVRGRRSELGPDFDNGGEFWTEGDGLYDYWAGQNTTMFNDYFDQEPLDNHDYVEDERWTRIDDTMLDILTFNANRVTHIDRREWQESDYIDTATGFINSQESGHGGIIYRELKR